MAFPTKIFATLGFAVQFATLAYANNALNVNTNTQNGKHADIVLTTWGSDFYFAVCAVMTVSALGIVGTSYLKPRSDRIFFYLCAAICFTAAIAYFTMGSNLGWTPIDVEFRRGMSGVRGRNRAIFYVRYIDWFITTPMLLTDLMLTAGLPWPSIFWTIFLDEGMVVTGLVGALVKTQYKWGFFVFGCACMLGVFYELAIVGRANAKRLGNDVHKVFLQCGVLTLFIWMFYPIAWGLCEGGNLITPSDEALFYGILDMIAKPVFSIALLVGHWNIKPERLGLRIPQISDGLTGEKTGSGKNGTSAPHEDTPGLGTKNE